MPTTAAIIEQSQQSGFGTRARFRFTFVHPVSAATTEFDSGIHRLAAIEDPTPRYHTTPEVQAIGDSMTAAVEAQEVQAERERAWQLGAYEGVDIDLEEWPLNGLDVIRKYFFRRLFNEQLDSNDDIDAKVITSVRGITYQRKHSNAAIRGWIDAGWGVNDVGSALSKRDALQIQYTQLDHGQGELSLDDF